MDDDRPKEDRSRWDNVIFRSKDPWDPESWSEAVHFAFEGYDTEPFWDGDGRSYIHGAHAWQVGSVFLVHHSDSDVVVAKG